ncbi:hypothetical protein [Falsiroseomonas sp. HW251]|uniref:AbiU2 domain-containing protein n=1 Tax=Falsiroseomonas sp. HW251 TaxID=3390998 RepID=UPI003D32133B
MSSAVAECAIVASRLHETVLGAVQNRALLEVANADKSLLSAFNNTYEAHGLSAIRHSLIHMLLIQVVRCWDGHRDHRASFPSLLKRLERPGATDDVIAAAASWNPGLGLETRNRELVRSLISELKDGVVSLTTGDAAARLKRLSEFRHTYVAHNLTVEPDHLPQYRDIFGLLDDTIPLAAKADLAIRGHHVDFADFHNESVEQARAFWAVVRAGQLTGQAKERDGA